MNILLYLPALLVLLVRSRGIIATMFHLCIMFGVQVLVARPFLENHPREYVTNAFEFSRVFLYKWTVNWRFLGETTFLSKGFALTLISGHLLTLLAFGLMIWCRNDGSTFRVIRRAISSPGRPAGLAKISSNGEFTFITETLYRTD